MLPKTQAGSGFLNPQPQLTSSELLGPFFKLLGLTLGAGEGSSGLCPFQQVCDRLIPISPCVKSLGWFPFPALNAYLFITEILYLLT